MIRLARDPPEPCTDRRIATEIEAAVRSTVRVSVERNVRNRISRTCKPVMVRQVCLHDAERGLTLRMPLRNKVASLLELLL